MIFVTLGTQDKSFKRLLKAIDKAISSGEIKDKVIVQAGYTKYKTDNMEIFDLCGPRKFKQYMREASIVITHGGVGSILEALKEEKPVIAAARLSKYKEHTNDHQKQIVSEFAKEGYLLELKDFSKIGELIKEAKKFKPKKYTSNTNNMIKKIKDYIDNNDHISWFNKYKYLLLVIIVIVILLIIF
ncbi:MAG: hypothetical protein IJI43_03560 [Bacilli bacterium]|nr:hypothetical protein [Bacilli bacterium]